MSYPNLLRNRRRLLRNCRPANRRNRQTKRLRCRSTSRQRQSRVKRRCGFAIGHRVFPEAAIAESTYSGISSTPDKSCRLRATTRNHFETTEYQPNTARIERSGNPQNHPIYLQGHKVGSGTQVTDYPTNRLLKNGLGSLFRRDELRRISCFVGLWREAIPSRARKTRFKRLFQQTANRDLTSENGLICQSVVLLEPK
jgi:hypothetical protein